MSEPDPAGHPEEPAAPERPEITRTTRDPAELRASLGEWLAGHLPGARLSDLAAPDNGMSSETVLFEATVPDPDGGEHVQPLVARLAAAHDAVPVFPSYDLEAQYDVMDLVRRHTAAPVPAVRFLERDPAVLGAPFFVMDRVHGRVPPDVLPYTMDSWLLEASAADQRRLQEASVGVLAEVHRTPVGEHTGFLELDRPGDTALRRHVAHWNAYKEWVADGRPTPLLDEAARWLEENWPEEADQTEPALAWGDARIGNLMYDGFDPVAVLDWEMAGIAPVEVDLGWMSFLHTFFQDLTEEMGMTGMPGFMVSEDVAATYEAASGRPVADLHWFRTYAAYRHGAIMVRVIDRQIHFGDAEPNDHAEDAVLHHERLRRMIGA